MRSSWEYSAPVRPRLSQTPSRIFSISAGVFSGKAAARLRRPTLLTPRRGPKVRAICPPSAEAQSTGSRRTKAKPKAMPAAWKM